MDTPRLRSRSRPRLARSVAIEPAGACGSPEVLRLDLKTPWTLFLTGGTSGKVTAICNGPNCKSLNRVDISVLTFCSIQETGGLKGSELAVCSNKFHAHSPGLSRYLLGMVYSTGFQKKAGWVVLSINKYN